MALSTPQEDRGSERKRVLKGAKISFAARCASLPCVVRDMSETGARLQVKDHLSVPDTFELIIELDGFEVDVEVVWRKANEVGVIFLDNPKITKATRTQIVGSSVPKPKGTLRRVKSPARRRPGAATRTDIQDDAVSSFDPDKEHAEAHHAGSSGADKARDGEVPRLATEPTVDDDLRVEDAEIVHTFDDADDAEVSCDAAVAALADQLTTLEIVADAPPSTNSKPPLSATTEAPTMDHAHPNDTTPLPGDVIPDASDARELPAQDGAPDQASTHATAAPVEAPIFRDLSSTAEAPTSFSGLDARISTALQAPSRAAENIVRPVVPIIPAPAPAAPSMQIDAPDAGQALSPVAPAETMETGVAQPQSHGSGTLEASIGTNEVDDTATNHPMPEREADALPAPSVSLRPELAAFVSAFAPSDVSAIDQPTTDAAPNADVALWNADRAHDHNADPASIVATNDQPDTETALADGQLMSLSDALAGPMTFTHAALDADGSSPTTMPVLADSQPVQVEIVDEAIVVTPFPAAPAEGSGADAADNESQLMGDPAQITRAEPEILTPVSSELVEMLTPDVAVATEGADEASMAIEPVFCEAKVGIPLDAPSQAATASNELMLTPTSTSTSKREAQEIVHTQDDILPCADDDGFELPAASVGAVSNAVTPPHAVAPDAERQIPILIAEDDPDDRMFMRDAFDESDFEHEIAFVENGEELLSYLKGEGEYASAPRPGLILLDLNMPKMDGRTALLHIKANPSLRRIPVIVLTTSRAEEDIEQTYDLGVSSYISKPSSADGLKEVIATLNGYWSNLVALPNRA